jgi:DUF4097 and DUF4098 domain-containing protein YvlB
MKLSMSGGKVVIDGREFRGNNVSIDFNGNVVVDGITQDGQLVGPVSVVVHGDVESIENSNGSVSCNNAGRVQTTNGKVTVTGSINGDVKTTNGDVSAASIMGKVSTVNGDITR